MVKDVSIFTTGISGKFWLSDKYNTFTPSGDRFYEIYVLFPDEMPVIAAKQGIVRVVKNYYSRQGEEVDVSAETVVHDEREFDSPSGSPLVGIWGTCCAFAPFGYSGD